MVTEPGRVELREVDVPGPAAGEVAVEVEYSALSPGTERHIIQGDEFRPPMALGYSVSGRISAVGQGVMRFKEGDLVVSSAPHGSHIVVDERAVVPAPCAIDLEQAAFFNLAHTALYGLRQSRLQFGEAVTVIGQGMVGLLAARLAVLAGGLPVIALDVDEQRLDLSRQLGIHHAINPRNQDQLRSVLEELPAGGCPVVIEVTGGGGSLNQALEIVSERGRIVLLGTAIAEEAARIQRPLSLKGAALIGAYVNSKPWALFQSDMQIKQWPPTLAPGQRPYTGPGIFTSSDDIRVILDAIRYGSLDVRPLITDRLRPDEVAAAYERVIGRDPRLVGAVIQWRAGKST
jgi:2-desacetyl-2-hydroxyethyl bacteriochlorophyllide A dehydrogenase